MLTNTYWTITHAIVTIVAHLATLVIVIWTLIRSFTK